MRFLALVFMSASMVMAQGNPPSVGAFVFAGGLWSPASTSSSGSPSPTTPPPVAMYCYNSGTKQWIPADAGCLGGGGGGGVNPGTATQIGYYASTGTAISGATGGKTNGTHFALGAGSQIDSNPYDGDGTPIVLNVDEVSNTVHYNTGLSVYREWTPNTDADAGAGVFGQSTAIYVNADSQATTSTASIGTSTVIGNNSNSTFVNSIVGVEGESDNTGNGDVQHLFGFAASANQQGTGNVTEDQIAVLASVGVSAGHSANLVNFYADPPIVSGSALIDSWRGVHVHLPINTSSHPITVATGIQVDVNANSGTTAYSINSTGDAPSQFAGSMKATIYQETLTTPASSSATCIAGQFTDDANFHYVCTATNTWKRVALSTF